jgi:hypothetical protein
MGDLDHYFLRSLLRFVVVRFGHDEGLGRIIFRSVFLTLRWQKEEEGRHQKEEVPQFRLQECCRGSLGICSQAICRVFACAVIHTAKHLTG